MKYLQKFMLHLLIIVFLFTQCSRKIALNQQLDKFFSKEDVTILVTDSGLGGLSVAADLADRIPKSGVFKNVRVVFFNSLFHEKSGYNSLKTEQEKVDIFNTALEAMANKYAPDLLLIACNTLSVIYDKTEFFQSVTFPVIGIVETGVDLIAKQFDVAPGATAIIFATNTTISSNSHKNRLIERGYSAEKIIGQSCDLLTESIEEDYDGEMTSMLISEFVNQALEKVMTDSGASIFASLNCTHYGYSLQQFEESFTEAGYLEIKIVNPNPKMSNFLFESRYQNRYPKTAVNVEVVSKTKISAERINSLGSLLQITSPRLAEALKNYLHDPGLFDVSLEFSL
jgi:glutamate racemase